jgi:hypothetical protein
VVSSTETFQRVVVSALQVELPTVLSTARNPGPAMREECRKVDLDTAVREGTRSLESKVSRGQNPANLIKA